MNFIDDVCQKIVSPNKLIYSQYDLGPPFLPSGNRQDFQVVNDRGHKLQASLYVPSKKATESLCVVYLHSMNGSRLESLPYVQILLSLGFCFCNFDFSGCGNSEGDTISFGANQKYDVSAIIFRLRHSFKQEKFVFWGRSMGSACAIKYCEMLDSHEEICGLILDSSYKSFSQLVVQIGHQRSAIPEFLIKAGYIIIRNTLQQKGNFKTEELELEPCLANFRFPILFLASETDKTVNCTHSKDLFASYSYYRKELFYINGFHNEARDDEYIEKVIDFIRSVWENVAARKKNLSKSKKISLKNILSQTEEEQLLAKSQECTCSLFSNHVPERDIFPRMEADQSISNDQRISLKRERELPK